MDDKKQYVRLKTLILALVILDSTAFAGDSETTHSLRLKRGVYVVVTVGLNQLTSGRKPELLLELDILGSSWSVDEIKSCLTTNVRNNCVRNRAEKFIKEFINFYNPESRGGPGILRVGFPEHGEEKYLEEALREESFKRFEENNASLLYQVEHIGKVNRSYKFVKLEDRVELIDFNHR